MDDIVSRFGREHVNTNIAVEFYITSSSRNERGEKGGKQNEKENDVNGIHQSMGQ